MIKNRVKRIMAVLLAAVMGVGLFTACGNADDGKLVVRVWAGDGATKEFMTKKVEEFNKAHNDIKIEYQVIQSGLDDMTKNAFENGDGPELFGGGSATMRQFEKLGYRIAIEELEGGKEYIENLRIEVPDDVAFIYNGKICSYPIESITGGLVYNKDLFREAGIVDENGEAKAPETWDEMLEACKKIKEIDGKYGIGIPMKDIAWPYGFCWAASASVNEVQENDFENQEVEFHTARMLEYVLKIKEDNTCFPGSESLDNDTLRLQFAEGNIGMFFGCSWDVGVLTSQFPAKCDWEVAPYPTFNKDEKYLQNGMPTATLAIGNSAIKTPEMSKAVMEVYAWLYSDEMMTEKYEEMLCIPYDTKAVENADTSKIEKQWQQFCEMQNITRAPGKSVPMTIEGDNYSLTYDKVWMGKMTIEEAINDLNTRYTAGLKKGIADGTINPDAYEKVNYKRGE